MMRHGGGFLAGSFPPIDPFTPPDGNWNVTGNVTASGAVLTGAGSVTACAVAFTGDEHTGLIQASDGVLGFVTNGTERVRIGSNFVPKDDNTPTLGSSAARWKELYVAGFWEGAEIADPAAPSANGGKLYFRDNGSGKTQLVVVFSSGAVQVIATQP